MANTVPPQAGGSGDEAVLAALRTLQRHVLALHQEVQLYAAARGQDAELLNRVRNTEGFVVRIANRLGA